MVQLSLCVRGHRQGSVASLSSHEEAHGRARWSFQPLSEPKELIDHYADSQEHKQRHDDGVLVQGARRPRHTVQGTFHLMGVGEQGVSESAGVTAVRCDVAPAGAMRSGALILIPGGYPQGSTGARDMAKGCGLFETRMNAGLLTHGGQKSLTDAVLGARKRPISDAGGWGWDRRDSTVTIHPVVAATLALLGAASTPVRRERRPVGRTAIVM